MGANFLSRAIVRPPGVNFAAGLTTADLGTPDLATALTQHEAYCLALERCGLTLTRLDADEVFPDATFVEDTAVLTEHCAILTRPGAPSRTGEVSPMRTVLDRFYSSIQSIQEPGTLDGGDVCDAGKHFFIGLSERTNETGAHQLADILSRYGYTSTFVDIRGNDGLLHLKSGLASLGDNRLVVTDGLAYCEAFRGYDLVRVGPGDSYAANCLCINDSVLIAAGYGTLEKQLQQLVHQTIALDMSEFQKMDGGLSCLSLRF